MVKFWIVFWLLTAGMFALALFMLPDPWWWLAVIPYSLLLGELARRSQPEDSRDDRRPPTSGDGPQ